MGTSCAEINSHLLMCAERSRGALNVEGAVNESNNLALLLIYAFPLKHNHSVPSYCGCRLQLCYHIHQADKYSGL